MAVYYGNSVKGAEKGTQALAKRTCKCCGVDKEETAFSLHDVGGYIFKRSDVCKACESSPKLLKMRPTEQRCVVCKQVKPIAEFKSKTGAINMTCTKCANRRKRNRERLKSGGDC